MRNLFAALLLLIAATGAAHANEPRKPVLLVASPELQGLYRHPVYFGGPEMVNAIFAVVRGDPGTDATRLFNDVFLVTGAEGVDRVIEQAADDARYFAGFVAWRPGELAREIQAGYWYVSDADPALLFRDDTEGLWQELIERLGNGRGPQRTPGFRAASY